MGWIDEPSLLGSVLERCGVGVRTYDSLGGGECKGGTYVEEGVGGLKWGGYPGLLNVHLGGPEVLGRGKNREHAP